MHPLISRHEGHKVPDQGYFTRNDSIVKYGFWILIGLVLAAHVLARLALWYSRSVWLKSTDNTGIYRSPDGKSQIIVDSNNPVHFPKSPQGRYWASSIRGFTYPRWAFTRRFRHFDPPSQGQLLFLTGYFSLLMALLWTNVIFESPVKAFGISWEVVGFRAAWVGTMQLPLLYATGCKYNIISLATGISHDRLNWFHRWVARTTFLVLIVHWAFFFQEWVLGGFVKQQFETMPMVIWGFVAWGAMGLMVLLGFGWFMERAFEVWLVSHIVLAWAVLALSYKHTSCTTYFVGASVGCLAFDLLARLGLGLLRNVPLLGSYKGVMGFGHKIHAEVLDEQYLRLVIKSPRFTWKAGNHVYLTIPSLRMFQSHPFTIANVSPISEAAETHKLVLIIKKHSGFTHELYDWAASVSNRPVRGFIRGPHGSAPYLKDQHTVVFVAMGNRTSYCTSLLQKLVRSPGSTHNILFHMIIPDMEMYTWYKEFLQPSMDICAASGITMAVFIHLTRGETTMKQGILAGDSDITADHFAIGRSSTDSDCSDEETRIMIDEKGGMDKPEFEMSTIRQAQENEEVTRSPGDDLSDDKEQLLPSTEKTSLACLSVGCQILEGRPTAESLLRDSVQKSGPDERIIIVAAVSAFVAASLSKEACKLISAGRNDAHSGDIQLWIEQNG